MRDDINVLKPKTIELPYANFKDSKDHSLEKLKETKDSPNKRVIISKNAVFD
jgi:hypothetical protein